MRKTIAEFVEQIADSLDKAGKADAPIAVVATRAHVRKAFPPLKRGGPLRLGEHELQLRARAKKAKPLPNHDWCPAEEPAAPPAEAQP